MQEDISDFYALIEKAIKAFNLDPVKTRKKEGEWVLYSKGIPFWLYLTYNRSSKEHLFQVSAPVLHMPTENRAAFCEQLMSLNGELIGAAFMEKKGTVYITKVREAVDLDLLEAVRMIERVVNYMNYYQESQKYGLLNWTPYKAAGPNAPGPSSLS